MRLKPSLQEILDFLINQKYPNRYRNYADKQTLRNRAECYLIKDGILHFTGWKKTEEERNTVKLQEVVWTKEERFKIVMAIHTSEREPHLNYPQVRTMLKKAPYHWPNMSTDAYRVLKHCRICNLKKKQEKANLSMAKKKKSLEKMTKKRKIEKTCQSDWEELSSPEEANSDSTVECTEDNTVECAEDSTVECTEDSTVECAEDSETFDTTTDVFFGETALSNQAREFWEEVEVKILGPYPAKPDSEEEYYVATFVDVFSVWTEMFVMQTKDLTSLTLAIFTLISKRGVMKTIIHKGSLSEATQLEKVLSVFSNEDCPVQVEHKTSSSLDNHWNRLRTSLLAFVRASPHDWFQYIEFFLLPFRASRAEHKDNTASYLFSSREMRLPASISHQKSEHRELQLTEIQIQQSIKSVQDLFYNSLTECDKVEKAPMEKEKAPMEKEKASMENKSAAKKRKGRNKPKSRDERRKLRKKLLALLNENRQKEEAGSYMYDYTNFSMVALCYLQNKGLPPGLSTPSGDKQLLSDARSYYLKGGKLYYRKANCGKGKEVLISEEDKFAAIKEAHVNKIGIHYSAKPTLDICSKYHWRLMREDIRAFVKACPRCRKKDPNLSEEEHSSIAQTTGEKTLENSTKFVDSTPDFRPIIAHLNQTVLTEDQKSSRPARTAALFCLEEDGSLYCVNFVEKKRRKVIMTPEQKKACLEEAHFTVTGNHRSKEFTHVKVVQRYYWPQMVSEVNEYVLNCSVCRTDRARANSKRKRGYIELETVSTDIQEATTSDVYLDIAGDAQWGTISPVGWKTPMEVSETMPINILGDTPTDKQEDMLIDKGKVTPRDILATAPDPMEGTGTKRVQTREEDSVDKYREIFEQQNLFHSKVDHTDHSYSAQLIERNQESEQTVISEANGNLAVDSSRDGDMKTPSETHQKTFSCPTCQLRFTTLISVTQHHLIKHSQVPTGRNFLCEHCGLEYQSTRHLEFHKETAHNKIFFSKPRNRKVQTKVHAKKIRKRKACRIIPDDMYKVKKTFCELCGSECKSITKMEKHKETGETYYTCDCAFKSFKCKHCHLTFSTKASLIHHDRLCDVKAGGILCKMCSTFFASQSELELHAALCDTRSKFQTILNNFERLVYPVYQDPLHQTEVASQIEVTSTQANIELK